MPFSTGLFACFMPTTSTGKLNNEQQRIQDLLQRTRRYQIRAMVYYSHIPQSKICVARLHQISANGTGKQQTTGQSALENNTNYKQRN